MDVPDVPHHSTELVGGERGHVVVPGGVGGGLLTEYTGNVYSIQNFTS